MSAAAASSVRTANSAHLSVPNAATHVKRKRVVRRRGRAKPAMDSDDEIEREVRSDSESEDDLSSSDSSSDSDTEPASEDVLPNDQPRFLTPGTSQSPDGTAKDVHVVVNGHNNSFFGRSDDWSEMVAAETAPGSDGLPVLDFSELNSQVLPIPSQSRKARKTQKHGRHASTASPPPTTSSSQHQSAENHLSHEVAQDSHAQRRRSPRRPPGRTARQAYQQRLEADPSYVPTVGEFWGHDDRLLDKDLRSLSGWWRGRWQGGFRGRGGFRGLVRGRGGFLGRAASGQDVEQEDPVQAVDRAWTHDGFEEMKRNEELSGSTRRPSQSHTPVREHDTGRGRGGSFVSRGSRGGRGTFSPSSRARRMLPLDPGRVWFLEKPEHVWTKQAESFLYFDSSSKSRGGESTTIRVKLPNQKTPAVRVLALRTPQTTTTESSGSAVSKSGSDYSDRTLVVRIPKAASSKAAVPAVAETVAEAVVADEPSIEDVFTVRPRLVSPKPIPLPEPTNRKSPISLPTGTHHASSSVSSIDPAIQQKLEQVSIEPRKSDPVQWKQTEEAVMRNPTGTVPEDPVEEQSSIPPVQPSFSSPQPSSPVYGSPYHFPPPLPPGVAINPAGMTYEVATGRPIYLPPPSSMYMQPAPFVPGHAHHRSTPPEFIPAGTPPINSYVEYIHAPRPMLFPRKSARITIRAPDGSIKKLPDPESTTTTTTKEATTQPAQLRSDAAPFSPSEQQQYFPDESAEGQYAGEVDALGTDLQQVQMGYAPYPYYYPEPYGYNPYVDMSQVTPYDMYAPPPPQGTVYYH